MGGEEKSESEGGKDGKESFKSYLVERGFCLRRGEGEDKFPPSLPNTSINIFVWSTQNLATTLYPLI